MKGFKVKVLVVVDCIMSYFLSLNFISSEFHNLLQLVRAVKVCLKLIGEHDNGGR